MQTLTDIKLEKLISGETVTTSSSKFVNQRAELQRAVSKYSQLSNMDYVRGVAQKLGFN